jgi:hypothetical protein
MKTDKIEMKVENQSFFSKKNQNFKKKQVNRSKIKTTHCMIPKYNNQVILKSLEEN